jgi:hypothetical protein
MTPRQIPPTGQYHYTNLHPSNNDGTNYFRNITNTSGGNRNNLVPDDGNIKIMEINKINHKLKTSN